jgi:uncharacterized protein
MTQKAFSTLGFGLGFRPCHYEEILASRPKSIDWLEVITENFMALGGKPRRILEQTREAYPIAIHGVGLSIGSPAPISQTYLRQLTELIQWLNPTLISDHLCFTTFGNHNSHDLLPVQYTRAMLDSICAKVNQVQQTIGRRLMLENPSAYVTYDQQDMSEVDFYCQLVHRTSCGILLDVNNLYVNQMNLGQDPIHYIKQLPRDCVGQIHLSGHSIETNELGTVRIDTHDHAVEDDVWKLYQYAIHKWPDASPMLEWDDHIPALSDLIQMLDFARALPPLDVSAVGAVATSGRTSHLESYHLSHGEFFSLAVDVDGIADDDKRLGILAAGVPVPRLLGARVYNGAYFARLHDVLKDEFPTLAGVTSEEGFAEIVGEFLTAHPPAHFNVSNLGAKLAEFLDGSEAGKLLEIDFGVALCALADIARLDRARCVAFTHASSISPVTKSVLGEVLPEQWDKIKFGFSPTLQILACRQAILPVWEQVNKGMPPNQPEKTAQTIAVWRHAESPNQTALEDEEATLLRLLVGGETFAAATYKIGEKSGEAMETTSSRTINYLVQCFDRGLVTHVEV